MQNVDAKAALNSSLGKENGTFTVACITALADEGTVKALKEIRLKAEDFEVKTIIGQGHFGEVCPHTHTVCCHPLAAI